MVYPHTGPCGVKTSNILFFSGLIELGVFCTKLGVFQRNVLCKDTQPVHKVRGSSVLVWEVEILKFYVQVQEDINFEKFGSTLIFLQCGTN
jgi:hypothetical protein